MPAVSKKGVSPELLAESLSRRPILLIGDVGVGKTTFTRNLTKVEAALLFDDVITLYIDLGSQATLTRDLREFMPEEIVRQLREDYDVDVNDRNFVRGVYDLDLDRFGKSIYADLRDIDPAAFKMQEINFLLQKVSSKEEHLKNALHHISKGRRKQIVIFIDNADQRDDETQQQAFLASQEMAQRWPATVFVALRPETFHRSMRSGALSGYHPKAFTIAPPRIDEAIEKRLLFAIKLCNGEIPIPTLSFTRVNLTTLQTLINVFIYSLAHNPDLPEFLDNISGGNVRSALDLVKGFFGSGHVDTQKIFDIYQNEGDYQIPLHEFLRAIIYGDAIYYDPSRSPVVNLFDISSADPREHFLLPLLIGFLVSPDSPPVDGFVETAQVFERLQTLGFTPKQIEAVVVRACKTKLTEATARQSPEVGGTMPHSLRATPAALYHNNRLCHQFTYMDAMVIDTPILDAGVRASITDSSYLASRLERADQFRDYLDNQWLTLKDFAVAFDWSVASNKLKREVQRIRTRTTRNESR